MKKLTGSPLSQRKPGIFFFLGKLLETNCCNSIDGDFINKMDHFSDLLKPTPSGNTSSPGSGTPSSSGRSTPGNNNGNKNSGHDSFADLVAPSKGKVSQKAMASMSLQERQKLAADSTQQANSGATRSNDVWSSGLDFLEKNGGKSSTPESIDGAKTASNDNNLLGGEDILSVSEPISHNNKPQSTESFDLLSGGLKDSEYNSTAKPSKEFDDAKPSTQGDDNMDEIFDVFNKPPPPPQEQQHSSPEAQESQRGSQTSDSPQPVNEDPRDPAIASLVEMGFSLGQAKRALSHTENGLDVQQAIDFLMNEAHQKSSRKQQQPQQSHRQQQQEPGEDYEPPDIGKLAQEFSSQFLSKAGSFWNQSRKNFAKAIEQYSGSSPTRDGTPAWMKESEIYQTKQQQQGESVSNTTEEASALDSHDSSQFPPPQSRNNKPRHERDTPSPVWANERKSASSSEYQSRRKQSSSTQPSMSRAQKFKAFGGDDDSMEGYVSPARRRSPAQGKQQSNASGNATPPPTSSATKAAPKPKPKPVREVISISSIEAEQADSARKSGNEAFKRGDFAESAVQYSKALESIPSNHLLRTIVLSNRATCYLKLGDAKAALVDSEEGVAIIGPGLGENEEAEPGKSLKDIWSKLVTKKAEATEHMEKFSDSLEAWNLLLNNGYSNKSTLDGRRRCQTALQPKKPVAQAPKPSTATSVKKTSPSREEPSEASKAAVNRIRTANMAAEKADAEKYELLDNVNERIAQWKGGKEDNLRALLASLDSILWPEVGWKSVSMADLVMPKKVKMAYMKAVAKTHPDKIANESDTEKKMIAQAVFVTLNQAWDGFKEANGLS